MFYKKHLFFCVNQRENKACCANHHAEAMWRYAKDRIYELGLEAGAGIRVNKAGCLGQCDLGPVLVVYPDDVWYTYASPSDIDEIIQSHIVDGRYVQRLRIDSPK